MIKVDFLGPIGLPQMELDVRDFDELCARLREIEELKSWLPLCALALNDEILQDSRNFPFKNGDCVAILPPVCGG